MAVQSARQVARFPQEEKNFQRQLSLARELGGKIIRRSGAFGIGEVIRWAREENIRNLRIVPARLGGNAVAMGAACLVLRRIFMNA